ncbi:hypothetical protein PGTUg99_035147 [Puccinia graminis f. sp. tritici]|uniref:Uncharacterized protein n=1 Tax=Puccinia graminis f. sp. tritici TaxID=56615 RepID=A0A5B0SKJ0_PUCGR|nr:hypothetical protein PGTUg99_035147 [Puccinia graminis f. sp. tritici]
MSLRAGATCNCPWCKVLVGPIGDKCALSPPYLLSVGFSLYTARIRPTTTTSRLFPRDSTDGGSILTGRARPTRHLADPFFDRCMTPPPIFVRASAGLAASQCSQPVGIVPAEIIAPAVLSSIKAGLSSPFSFPPHQLTSPASYSHHSTSNYPCFYQACSSVSLLSSTLTTMSSIFNNCDTNDFYCEGRSDPSIDIGVRYYPDRDQWSPVFNPNVVPDDNSVGDKGPIDPAGNKGPIDTVATKDKEPAEATVDPALINTISSIPDKVPIPQLFPKPHPFVCVPWNVHDPELPPGLPVPFLCTLNLPVPAPTPAQSQPPSTSSSGTSSNNSDASSTYPLISNYINLNHQGVQKLLLHDNTPPTAVCIYTEEDVMRIFEGIAPEYVDMCSEYPPSSLAESDRRVMFFENMQWFFRNKRSTYLSTRKF